jgi:N-methylhydantoinase B/oxoprolinase/acetone carboxylase alpha subunit
VNPAVAGRTRSGHLAGGIDPITFEVLRHRLWMINDEQGKLALQLAGSYIVYEAKDLNSSILTAVGDSLFVGAYTTRVALCLDVAAKQILKQCGDAPGIHEGDAFLTNDPWAGAGHQNDFMLLAPIFGEGKLIAWTGIAMHDVDVGGPVPGNYSISARSVFDEAPLIPPVKLVDRGEYRPDIEALVLRNSRTPDTNALNLRARLVAVTRTRERIGEIVDEYGADVFLDVQERILALVRKAFLRRLDECPDGTWRAEGYIDHDGTRNELYPIRVTLTKSERRLVFDYTGTSPQVAGPINCTRTGMRCGAVAAILSTLCFDMPWSPGALNDIIDIRAPDGTIFSAVYPAAVGTATVSGVYAASHIAHAAIAKMLFSSSNESLRLEAQANWACSLQVRTASGLGRGGEWFAAMLIDQSGGGGASVDRDGTGSCGSPGSPGLAIANVEVLEQRYPLLYLYRKECRDTGGPGRFRGGASTESVFITHGIDNALDVMAVNHGVSHPESAGLFGGLPGSVQGHLHLQGTNIRELFACGVIPTGLDQIESHETELLAAKHRGILKPGDAILAFASGGGGFGDPLERDPELVARDIVHGLCSVHVARDVYGVLLDAAGRFDRKQTCVARESLRAARLQGAPAPKHRVAVDSANGSSTGCFVTVQHEGNPMQACARCGTVHGPAYEDPRRHAICRTVPAERFSEWNRFGVPGKANVFEFYCPGCGLMIGSQVRKAGEDLYWDFELKQFTD